MYYFSHFVLRTLAQHSEIASLRSHAKKSWDQTLDRGICNCKDLQNFLGFPIAIIYRAPTTY